MPSFVLLEHDWPQTHFDLMLEVDEVLWTWRLPDKKLTGLVHAERIGNHRKEYLDYEGTVSGDRGTVQRREWGTFEWMERSDERIVIEIHGTDNKCTATWNIISSTWHFKQGG